MDLHERMEFDSVIEIRDDATVIDRCDLYAPEVYDNGSGDIDFAGAKGWTALGGYSGQDRYAGTIMHPSEDIGGALARDILSEPGIYTVVVVLGLDDDEYPSGWAVLRFDADTEPTT